MAQTEIKILPNGDIGLRNPPFAILRSAEGVFLAGRTGQGDHVSTEIIGEIAYPDQIIPAILESNTYKTDLNVIFSDNVMAVLALTGQITVYDSYGVLKIRHRIK